MKSTKYLVGVLACVAMLGAGCAGSTEAPASPSSQPTASAPAADNGPIKIGFIGPLTGDGASIGTVAQAAAQIAVDEINAAGGINGRKIEAVYEDGKCNAAASVDAANKLMNVDKVVAIDGGMCSSETAAFGPVAMQNKTVVVSYCSSAPTLTGMGKYFFRSYPSDAYQGKFAAEYAYNTLKARTVAIAYHSNDYGSGLKDTFSKRFEELGGKILIAEGSTQDNKDYRTTLAKIKGLKPDMIYAPLFPDGATAFMKQLSELGIKTKVFGPDTFADPKFQKAASGEGDLVYSIPVTPSADAFNAKVLAKTGGKEVPICAPEAYDNMKIFAQVIAQVGTDPDKIAEAMHQLNYQGVSGSISYDQNGDLTTAQYLMKKIVNGTNEDLK